MEPENLAGGCFIMHAAKNQPFKSLLRCAVPPALCCACCQVADMSQEVRNAVGTRLLKLTLKELFHWRYMQTGEVWTPTGSPPGPSACYHLAALVGCW